MSRIQRAAQLRRRGGRLVVYLTPATRSETSLAAVRRSERGRRDLVETGMPFSDRMAAGVDPGRGTACLEGRREAYAALGNGAPLARGDTDTAVWW